VKHWGPTQRQFALLPGPTVAEVQCRTDVDFFESPRQPTCGRSHWARQRHLKLPTSTSGAHVDAGDVRSMTKQRAVRDLIAGEYQKYVIVHEAGIQAD
jgi:hypothetical protein